MEILPASLIALAMCVGLGFMAMRGAGAAAQVMTQMFSSPADLGWPSGVQEDDDFHWSWSRLSARSLQRLPASPSDDSWVRPEIVELLDGTGPRASPVGRHRQVRSVNPVNSPRGRPAIARPRPRP